MSEEDDGLRDRLRRLAAYREVLESTAFSFGEWVSSWTDAEGVIHMPWYQLSPQAEAFLADVAGAGWIAPFDWGTWMAGPDGRRLSSGADAVSTATAEDLGRLLTAIVRSDRFSEGSLAGAFESGMLTAIVRRAEELAAE